MHEEDTTEHPLANVTEHIDNGNVPSRGTGHALHQLACKCAQASGIRDMSYHVKYDQ